MILSDKTILKMLDEGTLKISPLDDHQVQPVEENADEAADHRAEESVAAVELGHGHIAAQAEDRADAGEGRIPAEDQVRERTQRRRHRRLDRPLAHMERAVGDVHIIGIIRHDACRLLC